MDRRGDGHERLIGAHVRRRFRPPDVLLARLEGQDEGAPSVGVEGLARDPAGDLTYEFELGGEEPDVRASVREWVPEGLTFPDDDVGPELTRALQDAHGGRVGDGDRESPGFVSDPRRRAEVLDPPEEVRVRDHQAGGVRQVEAVEIGDAGLGHRNDLDSDA